ncbi:hypothetical protein CGLO_14928 [Colletotrichum gloeosporioides Cg-14]|uniref:Uncharacterized protein n=1 Tax=Colletotrichum gloeosporioides (strain Cg-14) TaxID=1237896 RepID=T0LCL9_COLGC|nr:hypothetical protein CGLO_14928 [Colletotrichum gloeosporioides Cg-14]
MKFNYYITI